MKRLCRECETRRPVEDFHEARHHGGGNWRRAGRDYASSICTECVIDLAPNAANARGHSNVGALHWGTHSILRAARSIGWAGPDLPSPGVRRLMAERTA